MKKFSIVSYFDEPTTQKLIQLQKELSKITGSTACLRIWKPHLTVGSGIRLSEKETRQFRGFLKSIANSSKRFTIQTTNLKEMVFPSLKDAGKNSIYVIYLEVKMNKELTNLVNKIKNITDKSDIWYVQPEPYMPHITLAFSDLTKEGYDKAKNFTKRKKFPLKIKVDSVSLAVEDKSGKFTEFRRFSFG